MTEEELEAFSSSVYDDLMTQFAKDETTSEDSHEKKNSVVRKFKKVEKTFWEMTPEEQYA